MADGAMAGDETVPEIVLPSFFTVPAGTAGAAAPLPETVLSVPEAALISVREADSLLPFCAFPA